jgi:hypothetical protein
VPVINQLSQEDGQFFPGPRLNTMHHADGSKFPDVHIEAFRLLDAVRISRHHVTLDAGNGPLLAHHPNPDTQL